MLWHCMRGTTGNINELTRSTLTFAHSPKQLHFATDAFENVNEAGDPLLEGLVTRLGEQLQREFAPYILADALAK